MKRRIMAWVMCLMMILTMLPTPTYAAEVASTAEQTEVGFDASTEVSASQSTSVEARDFQSGPPEEAGDQAEEAPGQVATEESSDVPKHAPASAVDEASPDGGEGSAPANSSLEQGSADEGGSASGEPAVDGEQTSVPTEVVDSEATDAPTQEPAADVNGEPAVEEIVDGAEPELTGEEEAEEEVDHPLFAPVATDALEVHLSRHEDDKGYTVAGGDIIFKMEITGGTPGDYKVEYRVEHAGDTIYDSATPEENEPSTKMVTEKITTSISEGEFSYPASQVGVYRLTVIVVDALGDTAQDQLSFAVISSDPVYVCGMELHEHTDACYAMVETADDGAPGIIEGDTGVQTSLQRVCGYSYEHPAHDESCLPSCGKIAHKHVKECYNDDQELICGLEEHTHTTESCYAGAGIELVQEVVQEDELVSLDAAGDEVDLKKHVVDDKGGTLSFSLAPADGSKMEKDGENNYIVKPGTEYTLSLQMELSDGGGFIPGTEYVYGEEDFANFFNNPNVKFPENPRGTVKSGNINCGDWWIDGDGKLHVIFNEEVNAFTSDVSFAVNTTVSFSYTDKNIEMPGGTDITMEAPEGKKGSLSKHGDEQEDYVDYWHEYGKSKVNGVEKEWTLEKNQILWRVKIDSSTMTGDELNRVLAGLMIKDTVKDSNSITDQDKGKMLFRLTLGEPDNPSETHTHVWMDVPVYSTDEKGRDVWTYMVPDKIKCIRHGTEDDGEAVLNDDGMIDLTDERSRPWTLYIYYTTTIYEAPERGTVYYKNEVKVGETYEKEDTIIRSYGDVEHATIVKDGEYDENGDIQWTIKWDTI